MMRMPGAAEGWPLEVESFGKGAPSRENVFISGTFFHDDGCCGGVLPTGGQFETAPWHTWAVDGGSPDYPIEVLEATMREIGAPWPFDPTRQFQSFSRTGFCLKRIV
jgi:hypothetical protein